jgi:hypothetical protein
VEVEAEQQMNLLIHNKESTEGRLISVILLPAPVAWCKHDITCDKCI